MKKKQEYVHEKKRREIFTFLLPRINWGVTVESELNLTARNKIIGV